MIIASLEQSIMYVPMRNLFQFMGHENPTNMIQMHSIIYWRYYEVSWLGLGHLLGDHMNIFLIVSLENGLKISHIPGFSVF